jgi:endonuclease YncB( thermonuclease family)
MRIILAAAVAIALLSPVAAQTTAPIDENSLYIYRANVIDVYDGDSITVDLDLGFYIWLHKQEFRLHGINAPKVTGPEKTAGDKAREFLRNKILGKQVIIQSIVNPKKEEHKEKTGEFLAIVWLDGVNLNNLMIEQGHATADH